MSLQNILSRRNRILLRELVVTDFKLRYQGSVLGYIWSLLKPLMLFAILYVVFIKFMRFEMPGGHGSVQLLLGIVLWSFFVEATSQGMQAIVARGDLIRKINFPKYIIVISGTISALINLLLNLVVVLVFILINGVDLSWSILLFPLAQIIQDARHSLISHDVITANTITYNPMVKLIPYVIVIVIAVIATIYFKRHQRFFAENI